MARKAREPMQVTDLLEQGMLKQYRALKGSVLAQDTVAEAVFTTVVSLRVDEDGRHYTHYESRADSARVDDTNCPEEQATLLDTLALELMAASRAVADDRDALMREHGVDPARAVTVTGDLSEHEAHALLEKMDAEHQRQIEALRAETPELTEAEAHTILLATAPAGRTT